MVLDEIDAAKIAKDALRNVLEDHSEYDSRLCCGGHECGCQGATVFQSIEHYFTQNFDSAMLSARKAKP